MVRALTSYQCGPGSILGLGAWRYMWVEFVVCCWFSSLLRGVFLRVLRFSPLLINQHFQIPMRSWRCPQLAFCAKYRPHLNKVIYLNLITWYSYSVQISRNDHLIRKKSTSSCLHVLKLLLKFHYCSANFWFFRECQFVSFSTDNDSSLF